ncbi:MAG: hypothetical protein FJ109_20615 [Deltaproteobacteria bacterium]|nr:hypothetical protein [Deltaproteobacteria bacterium]
MKPSAFELFCMYHLGLSPDFRPKFYNLNMVASHFGVSPDEVKAWLEEYHLSPEIFRHIDFNLAVAHGRAQEAAMLGSKEEIRAFAQTTFDEMRGALGGYDEKKDSDDVDYDDLLGKGDGEGPDDNIGNRRDRPSATAELSPDDMVWDPVRGTFDVQGNRIESKPQPPREAQPHRPGNGGERRRHGHGRRRFGGRH